MKNVERGLKPNIARGSTHKTLERERELREPMSHQIIPI